MEQILDFARTAEPHKEPLDINQVIDETELLVRYKLSRRSRSGFRISFSPACLRSWMDCGQIEQVLLNLILNAAGAMLMLGH